MNPFLYIDEEEDQFGEYYYHNSCSSPVLKKPNDNIGKDDFYEAEGNYNDNKENTCYVFIEKTTKASSKDNVSNFQKENEEKNIININIDNNSLIKLKEENMENKVEKEKEKEEKKERKKCGRKRLRSNNSQNEHNKYSDDNIRRKIKHFILKNLLIFLNIKIKEIYIEIGNGIFKKELQTINQSQKSDATINFNINFLQKPLSEIFSENISGRFTNLPSNHNKSLINQLLNEKDEEKRIYFRKLFGLHFIDCLRHFRGEEHINILDGLVCFKDMKNEILIKYAEDGNDYYETLKYYLNNYENIIYKKKARKSRKKDDEEE